MTTEQKTVSAPSIEQIASNFYKIHTNEGCFWYSYSTCIAFKPFGGELVIRENQWSVTTGKHLNAIDTDKSIRIPGDEFCKIVT